MPYKQKRTKEQVHERYLKHRDWWKNYSLKKHYGLTLVDFGRLLERQNGKCAICGTDSPKGKGQFHVDHDKTTGKVRGLLCANCNVGIAQLKHDITVLLKAVLYLRN